MDFVFNEQIASLNKIETLVKIENLSFIEIYAKIISFLRLIVGMIVS